MGPGHPSGQTQEDADLPMVKIVSLEDFADLVVETAKSAEGEF